MKASINIREGHISHTTRKIISKNVNKDLTHLNYINFASNIKSEKDFKKYFNKFFSKEVDEYNINQKRDDRKIKDYYEKCKTSKNDTKHFKEMIIQVGNCKEYINNPDLCKKIYLETLKEINSKYKNHVQIFGFAIHYDEPEGTPHMHVDFIPFGTDYKKGMKKQLSWTKALNQLGFEDVKHSKINFARACLEILESVCIKNNVMVERNELGKGTTHLDIDTYRATEEAKEEIKKDTLERLKKNEINLNNIIIKEKKDNVIIKKSDLEALINQSSDFKNLADLAEDENKAYKEHIKEIKSNPKYYDYIHENNELKKSTYELNEENKQLKEENSKLVSSYNELANDYNNLIDDHSNLENKYNYLEKENKELRWYKKMYYSIVSAFHYCKKIGSIIEKFIERKSSHHDAKGNYFYASNHILKNQEDIELLNEIIINEQDENEEDEERILR